MSERKQLFIASVLGSILGILIFATILTNNILRERNLRLNEYAIYHCNIERAEIVTEYKRP